MFALQFLNFHLLLNLSLFQFNFHDSVSVLIQLKFLPFCLLPLYFFLLQQQLVNVVMIVAMLFGLLQVPGKISGVERLEFSDLLVLGGTETGKVKSGLVVMSWLRRQLWIIHFFKI